MGKEEAQNLLLGHIQAYQAYHSQKETMTWAVATLFVAAAAVLLGTDPFWAHWNCIAFISFLLLLLATGIAAFLLLKVQFARRRSSSHFFSACVNTVTRWVKNDPSDADLEPTLIAEFGKSGELAPAALAKEFKEIDSAPNRNVWWDKVLTYVVMSLWGIGALVKVALTWKGTW